MRAMASSSLAATPVLLSRGDVVVALGKPSVGACGARGLVTVNQYAVVVQHGNDCGQEAISNGTVD